MGILGAAAFVGVAYSMIKIPSPNAEVSQQGSVLYYRDGKTPLAKLGQYNRQIVSISQVPAHVQAAMLAAEDRGFRQEAAISPTGIARAVFNNLAGGSTQGGSTITQQLVKNYYLNQQRTFTRKFKELFISIKIEKRMSKDQILQDYLNTIYFGRGAYGIQAAAQAYYRKNVADLTIGEAAVVAANIALPGGYDPIDPSEKTATVSRYEYVIDGMAAMRVLTPDQASQFKSAGPPMTKPKGGQGLQGQTGYYVQRTENALHNMGYTDQEIQSGGLRVTTTFDPKLGDYAKQAVDQETRALKLKSDIRFGLACVDPTNGEIFAAYGGKDYVTRQIDDAYQSTAQVGSSFKPYVLAAALQHGIGLNSTFDATAPVWIDPQGDRVRPNAPGAARFVNAEGNTTGVVNLIQAMQMSYNTVYVPLGFKTGTQNVVNLAKQAGLPPDTLTKDSETGGGSFFLGQAAFSPLDQAGGYSAFANDGQHVTPHSIMRVEQVDKTTGTVAPYHADRWSKPTPKEAFSSAIASNVDAALQAVVKSPGTGVNASLADRPVAGKTGTTNDSKAAWFVGYTHKQMVTSVGMWNFNDKTGKYGDLMNIRGFPNGVMGGDIPAKIWHDFMTKALAGKDVAQFPPVVPVGTSQPFAPRPKPTASSSPKSGPTQACPSNLLGGKKTCHNPQPTNSPACDPVFGPPCPSPSPSPQPTNPCAPLVCSGGGGGPGGRHGGGG